MPYKDKEKQKEYQKKYRLQNKEKIKERTKQCYLEHKKERTEYGKQYCLKNKDKLKQWRKNNHEKLAKYMKEYNEKNKLTLAEKQRRRYIDNHDIINKHQRNKRKTNLKFNLNEKISSGIRESTKGNKSGWHWETLVGYTLKDLKKRLQKTMPNGYTWQDFIDGKLHIDHIIPKSVFNFTKPEHIDFKRCWALENLQLLPANENLRKHNKLTKPFQQSLKIKI
jgi:5-methylcytosine-specific restriction endonuclease McrA